MEVKENPGNEIHEFDNQEDLDEESTLIVTEDPRDGANFGPPRHHTLINAPPAAAGVPPFVSHFPPPPSIAREGRSSPMVEMNPDAEMIEPSTDTAEHHVISVN